MPLMPEREYGGLERVLRTLSRPGWAFRSALEGEGKAALKHLLNLVMEVPALGLYTPKDLPYLGKYAKKLETRRREEPDWGIAGNIIFDPLTYIGLPGGGAAASLAKIGLQAGARRLATSALRGGLTKVGRRALAKDAATELAGLLARSKAPAKVIKYPVAEKGAGGLADLWRAAPAEGQQLARMAEERAARKWLEKGAKGWELKGTVNPKYVKQGGVTLGLPFMEGKTVALAGKDVLGYTPAGFAVKMLGKLPAGKHKGVSQSLGQWLGRTFKRNYGMGPAQAAIAEGARNVERQLQGQVDLSLTKAAPLVKSLTPDQLADFTAAYGKFDPRVLMKDGKYVDNWQELARNPEVQAQGRAAAAAAEARILSNPATVELKKLLDAMHGEMAAGERVRGILKHEIAEGEYLKRSYLPEDVAKYRELTGKRRPPFVTGPGGKSFARPRQFEDIGEALAAGRRPEMNPLRMVQARGYGHASAMAANFAVRRANVLAGLPPTITKTELTPTGQRARNLADLFQQRARKIREASVITRGAANELLGTAQAATSEARQMFGKLAPRGAREWTMRWHQLPPEIQEAARHFQYGRTREWTVSEIAPSAITDQLRPFTHVSPNGKVMLYEPAGLVEPGKAMAERWVEGLKIPTTQALESTARGEALTQQAVGFAERGQGLKAFADAERLRARDYLGLAKNLRRQARGQRIPVVTGAAPPPPGKLGDWIASGMDALPERGGFTQLLHLFNLVFKPAVTVGFGVPTPAFHARNILNAAWQGLTDEDMGWRSFTFLGPKTIGVLRNIDNPAALAKMEGWGKYSAPEFADLLKKWGVTRAFAATELTQSGMGGGALTKLLKGVNYLPSKTMLLSEGAMRANMFGTLLQKGLAPAEAAARVNKAFVDYTMVSAGQRTVRDIIPFAQYYVGTVPNVLETIARRPRFATPVRELYTRTGAKREGKEPILPEHLRGQPIMPFGKDAQGNPKYISQLGTIFDPLTMLQEGNAAKTLRRTILGSMTPALKFPLEIATGKDFFFGGDLTYGKTPPSLQKLGLPAQMDPRMRKLIQSQPFARQINIIDKVVDERQTWLQKALNLLSGVKVESVDEERALQQLTRNYLQERAAAGDVRAINRFSAQNMDPQLAEIIRNYGKSLKKKATVARGT